MKKRFSSKFSLRRALRGGLALALALCLLCPLAACGRVAEEEVSSVGGSSAVSDGSDASGESTPPETNSDASSGSGTTPEQSSAVTPETPTEDTEMPSEEPETPSEDTETPADEPETPVNEPDDTGTEPQSRAEEILSTMTLEEKIWQLFVVRPETLASGGSSGGDGELDAVTSSSAVVSLSEKPVGGVVLFAQNIETRSQTISLISGMQEKSALGLLISVDEEGGIVSRIGKNENMGTTQIVSMASIGATGDPDAAYDVGETIGSEITQLGFNLDFAPVADVNSNPDNTVIGNRAFGSDADTVADFVAAAVRGFHAGGIACTLKHFPGHGDTAEDTHTSAASTDKTLSELWDCELLPFQSGIDAGADCVMVAHISAPNALGSSVPASLNAAAVTDLLRGELGFTGVAITDSLRMAAVTDSYTSGEAAVAALRAGEDILLDPLNLDAAFEGVLEAVEDGRLTEARIDESVLRILNLKLEYGVIS